MLKTEHKWWTLSKDNHFLQLNGASNEKQFVFFIQLFSSHYSFTRFFGICVHYSCGILFIWFSMLLFFFGGSFSLTFEFVTPHKFIETLNLCRQTDECIRINCSTFFCLSRWRRQTQSIHFTHTDTFILYSTIIIHTKLMHGFPYAHGNKSIYSAEIYMVLSVCIPSHSKP